MAELRRFLSPIFHSFSFIITIPLILTPYNYRIILFQDLVLSACTEVPTILGCVLSAPNFFACI